MMSPQRAVEEIQELLYPHEDPDRPWDADTLEAVGETVELVADLSDGSPEAETIRKLKVFMWPPEDPERPWEADTIEGVAWIMEEHQKKAGETRAAPGLLEKVNRDRARRGQRALEPGEWSHRDLEEFSRHVRNPGTEALKRRLMR